MQTNLTTNSTSTLPFECSSQIRTLAVGSATGLLLAIDDEGRALIINKQRRTLLHRFSFKGAVAAADLSPDGRFIACAMGHLLQVGAIMHALACPGRLLHDCAAA